jgi:hypothetical protein
MYQQEKFISRSFSGNKNRERERKQHEGKEIYGRKYLCELLIHVFFKEWMNEWMKNHSWIPTDTYFEQAIKIQRRISLMLPTDVDITTLNSSELKVNGKINKKLTFHSRAIQHKLASMGDRVDCWKYRQYRGAYALTCVPSFLCHRSQRRQNKRHQRALGRWANCRSIVLQLDFFPAQSLASLAHCPLIPHEQRSISAIASIIWNEL